MIQVYTTPLFYVLILGIFVFLFSFISGRKHLLATLLSLEGLMLIIFSSLYLLSLNLVNFSIFVMIFLTLSACEGALGLSLLITITRSYGSDKFNSLNFLQC